MFRSNYTRWLSKLATWQLGGFPWWQSCSMVAVGLLMAYATSLRYGDPSHTWITVLAVLIFAACLMWWSHVKTRDPKDGDQPHDD